MGKKLKKVTLSVAVVLFDMEVRSNSTHKKFYRSRPFGDPGQRSLVSFLSTSSKDFSSETTKLISINFYIQLLGQWGRKFYTWSRSQDQDARHDHI